MDLAEQIIDLADERRNGDLAGPELLPVRLMRACAKVLPVAAAGISLLWSAARRSWGRPLPAERVVRGQGENSEPQTDSGWSGSAVVRVQGGFPDAGVGGWSVDEVVKDPRRGLRLADPTRHLPAGGQQCRYGATLMCAPASQAEFAASRGKAWAHCFIK